MREIFDTEGTRCLEELCDTLDTLGLDDAVGWENVSERLNGLSEDMHEREEAIIFLFDECRRGLRQVSSKSSGDALGLIGAIGDALEAASAFKQNDPRCEQEILHVTQVLGGLLEMGNVAEPPQTVDSPEMDYMPDDADLELLGEFVTEANELLTSAEEALLTLETDPEDPDAVGTVFRAFHTIKGTAGFLDLSLLSELGHHAESLLSRVRDGEIQYSGGYADLSLRALDMLKELIQGVRMALTGEPLRKPPKFDLLSEQLSEPESAGITDLQDENNLPRVGDILVAQGKADRQKVEEVAAECTDEPLGVCLVKAKVANISDVGKALRARERMRGSQKALESSVRVSTRRLDRLIDMVGELVVAHSMVAQNSHVTNGESHELLKKVNHTTKIVRELQDISMSMRMIPLKGTFQKMARLVRDLSRKVGKDIRLITEGEDTEIDRNMVDFINDPLVHMIRNAVDHGIESPDVRKKSGKGGTGEIRLSAYHSAGSVVVEIRDDGQGLDREAILDKAMERGIIKDRDGLSSLEISNLIFEPGFSTAKAVTDVSGRGVGMDVVKKNLEALRGHVEIRSEPGKGSIFKMRLPLTLAIIDGMVVRVGSERYVIPTISILKTIKPEEKEISTLLQKGEMFDLQEQLIPIHRFAKLFHIKNGNNNIEDGLMVVVECNGMKTGLMIDELLGRQQVVIKTLGDNLRNIPGISGGAVMPDGRVGLIIDVEGLIKLANSNGQGHNRSARGIGHGTKSKIPEESNWDNL